LDCDGQQWQAIAFSRNACTSITFAYISEHASAARQECRAAGAGFKPRATRADEDEFAASSAYLPGSRNVPLPVVQEELLRFVLQVLLVHTPRWRRKDLYGLDARRYFRAAAVGGNKSQLALVAAGRVTPRRITALVWARGK